jgi:hypothetical protein
MRFLGILVVLMVLAMTVGFAVAHFGLVVLLVLAVVFLGRHLRRHGV